MSNKVIIPQGYKPKLSSYELQLAISSVKRIFLSQLSHELNLKRVSAPLFVKSGMGINDNLNGTERPVSFDIPACDYTAEIVHSLAKWKRFALKEYGFKAHNGLVTDMNAIRRDEELDNLHSIYVDQWDWEKVIKVTYRNEEYLKTTVRKIVKAIHTANDILKEEFSQLTCKIDPDVTFISSQELEDMYPALTPVEREHEFTKLHKTVFITQIGDLLKSGQVHGNRAPDYDDWALNGDLLIWNEVLGCPIEISSMGIRVDSKSLKEQLKKAGCEYREKEWFHQMLLNDELPLTIGGGIGQSRLCMLLLQCAHIGEVQSSLWDEETKTQCKKHNIPLL
ncbi:MAG: aspartate--ammonia ligase [Eubacteriales bacterium]|nr:aspartate--ammonia ligase [Eubacteriales bacterium]